jgi:hypothetical protein
VTAPVDDAAAALDVGLAAEHAAIFAYGPIGARLGGTAAAEARAADLAHRNRRDALVLRLAALGATPSPAAAAYALPFPITDKASALRLATQIEERTAAVWRAALPRTTDADRRTALDALIDCAVRATRWRRAAGATPATVAFPGRPS